VGLASRCGQKAALACFRRIATLPFDDDRRAVSVLVEGDIGSRTIITKGAAEGMLERCADVPGAARAVLDAKFAAGNRVIAVASRAAPGQSAITAADEHGLRFRGLLGESPHLAPETSTFQPDPPWGKG
jgi:P-type Mg2+ transporter